MMFGDDNFFTEQLRKTNAGGGNSFVSVLLHSTSGDDAKDERAVRCLDPFQLTNRMWLCRLPDKLRDIVYDACESPGVPRQKIFRQYGQLYTIALFAGEWMPGQQSAWDAHGEITLFVTYSQLVHTTSIGFGNAARLTFGPDSKFIRADPGPCRGITEYAFTIPHHRNWLSKSECEQIRNLLATSNFRDLPDRVARANWNIQHSLYQYFFEVRTLLVVSGLEALLHTRTPALKGRRRRPGTGEQFVSRTKRLADLLGIHFTSDDAMVLWDHRSDVAHGRDPWAARRSSGGSQQPPVLTKSDETVRRYICADHILRTTVLKCLTDKTFAEMFVSDDSVEKFFPI